MKAELIDSMGNDLTVVNAARVSFDKESDWIYEEKEEVDIDSRSISVWKEPVSLKEGDKKLINYLAKHGHWTPFSHVMITMRETVPIFVARQRFKHMVGFAYNEVSRRYVDDEPEFFMPDTWRKRPDGSVKQGSSDEVVERITSSETAPTVSGYVNMINASCLYGYNKLLEAGVAPEQARMVLPQSMYTSYYVTGSLAAWARAHKLRIDSHAQKEIQDLAKQWNEIIQPLCPVSWAALTEQE